MQIESILAQTRLVDEIILRDDASGPDYFDSLQTLAATDARISLIIAEKNLGYAGNFIEGLRLTSGAIVFFADQDDVWHRNKVEKVCAAFDSTNALLVYHDQDRVFPDLAPKGSTTAALYAQHGRIDAFVHGCATAIARDFKPIALSRPEGFAHDDWMHAIARRLGRRVFLDEPLMKYRIHPASASRNKLQADPGANRFAERLRFRERLLAQALEVNAAATEALAKPVLWRDVNPGSALRASLAREKFALDAGVRLLNCGLAELPIAWLSAMVQHGMDRVGQLESLKDIVARLAIVGKEARKCGTRG